MAPPVLWYLLVSSVAAAEPGLGDLFKEEWIVDGGLPSTPMVFPYFETTEIAGKYCKPEQCHPGNCLEVLGQPTCICPAGFDAQDGKCIMKKCSEPYLCWPGVCIFKYNREKCLCPEGYFSTMGICKRLEQCKSSISCLPGLCSVVDGKETCFYPPKPAKEGGRKCHKNNCNPGKCIVENKKESCLCPSGYTSKDDLCMEISIMPGKMSTIMMMVLVACASAILTICVGLIVCCIFSHRR